VPPSPRTLRSQVHRTPSPDDVIRRSLACRITHQRLPTQCQHMGDTMGDMGALAPRLCRDTPRPCIINHHTICLRCTGQVHTSLPACTQCLRVCRINIHTEASPPSLSGMGAEDIVAAGVGIETVTRHTHNDSFLLTPHLFFLLYKLPLLWLGMSSSMQSKLTNMCTIRVKVV
jgi:hypothetical protein